MSTRRELLKSLSLVAAFPAARLAARQLQVIGVQLYTVRDVLPQKPAETLRSIEAIGYREIEATYDGLDRLWPAIQATHLKAVSVHLLRDFGASFGIQQSGQTPFLGGLEAMVVQGPWWPNFIEKYAPGLEWGVAPCPTADRVARVAPLI